MMAEKKKLTGKISEEQVEANKAQHLPEAQHQAEEDIENDPDLSTETETGDDLDEGELARLEGED